MKNLKKVLAFVTMITMLLSVAVSAGTLYPDVDDAASYAEAVTTLNALDIMIGDENGNFNPDASITRAEAAAIVTRMKALSGAASAAGGTKFTDVAADHWAAGYVNLAEQSGIINGYGDGTFGPSDAVTYEQIIKMIVAALGRSPEAETKGGYPSGYLIVASQERITNGVTVTPGAPAPRAAVARLVFNALEVNTMEQVTFKVGEEEYQVVNKTLLKDYLKVVKFEGIVDGTYLTAATIDTEDDKISLDVTKVNGYAVSTTEGAAYYTDLYPSEGLAEGDTDAASLIGKSVSAYAKEDEETNEMVLIGIAEKSGRNKELVLDESQIETYTDNLLEYFAKSTDSKKTKVELADADDIIWIYNNGYDAADGLVDAFLEDVVADEDVFGTVTLIDYDNDEIYDVIKLMQATANYVVGEVNATAKSLDDREGNNIPIDVEDEDIVTVLYNADGAVIDFADIAAENVITLYENANGLVAAYVSDVVVTGTVGEENSVTGFYTIGDADYKIAYVGGAAEETLSVGDEGKFYVNVEGKIVDKVATAAVGTYAYLFKALSMSDINGDSIEMKFLTSDGAWETKTLAAKVSVKIGAADATTVTITSAATDAFAPLMVWNAGESTYEAASDATARVFQYTTNSAGQINKLFIANGAAGNDEIISLDKSTAEAKEYSASKNKVGSIYLNDETKIFSVPTVVSEDEDDYTVTKVSALFVDGSSYKIDAYDIANNIPSLVVAYDASADILQGTKLLVITKISDINNAANVAVKKVYGYQEGAEVSGVTSEDLSVVDRAGDPTTLAVGDVAIFSLNGDGEIDKVQVLMSRGEAEGIIAANGDGFAAINETDLDLLAVDYFGFVAKKANGLLYLDESYKWEGSRDALVDIDGEEVALAIGSAKGVNVYEINLNNSNKTTQVLKGVSYIDAEDRAGKDSHWAYVRVYDDAIVDIVVYRTTNVALDYSFDATYYADAAAATTALGAPADEKTVVVAFEEAVKAGEYWLTISNGETTYGIMAVSDGTMTKAGLSFVVEGMFEAWPDGVSGIAAGTWYVELYDYIDADNASYEGAEVLAGASFTVA